MRAQRTALFPLLVGVVTILASALTAQDAPLRYRWSKGETMRYRAIHAANVSMSNLPGAGAMTVDTHVTQVQRLDVTDLAADGTATIRVTFESVKLDMTTPMGSIAYDSAMPAASAGNPVGDMIGKSYGAMVGETVTLVVTPSGEIKSVTGMEELIKKMTAAVPQNANMPGMSSFMTEDTLRTLLEQNFPAMPNRGVKAGETWQHNKKVKTAMGLAETAMTFAFKGVETRDGRQLASLTVNGTSKVTTDAAAATAMGMQMTLGAGTSQGELTIDTKAGRLYRSSVQSTQPMSMSMTGPDGSPMNIDAVTKTTLTVELIV
jgi:hypothetical protein